MILRDTIQPIRPKCFSKQRLCIASKPNQTCTYERKVHMQSKNGSGYCPKNQLNIASRRTCILKINTNGLKIATIGLKIEALHILYITTQRV